MLSYYSSSLIVARMNDWHTKKCDGLAMRVVES
jgi:hypothetical protein